MQLLINDIDICLIEHNDAIKFSKYLKRIPTKLRCPGKRIYDAALDHKLYCPSIINRRTIITFKWTNEEDKYIQTILDINNKNIQYIIGDDSFKRDNYFTNFSLSEINMMFLELSYFIKN